MKRYFGNWESYAQVLVEISEMPEGRRAEWLKDHPEFPTDERVLFATYDQESYEGSAQMLFLDPDGNLREWVNSHCSCYGIEDTDFSNAVVTWESLALRPESQYYLQPDALAFRTALIAGRGEVKS